MADWGKRKSGDTRPIETAEKKKKKENDIITSNPKIEVFFNRVQTQNGEQSIFFKFINKKIQCNTYNFYYLFSLKF